MTKAPKKIYVRTTDKTVMLDRPSDADDNDVEYVRADIAYRLRQYLDAIETECIFAVDPKNYTYEAVVELRSVVENCLYLSKKALNPKPWDK
jgi:hypothetical protein